MEETILLELQAVDFKDTDYYSPCTCAISKATMRQLNARTALEEGKGLTIYQEDGSEYEYVHEFYSDIRFYRDMDIAKKHEFDSTIIRTITLNKWKRK